MTRRAAWPARRYGGPDTRTAAEKLAAREAKFTAILAMLDAHGTMTPNHIGQVLKADGHRVPTPHGHSGKRLGEGSSIAPTLGALDRRGWTRWTTPRPDGLSGRAVAITPAGLAETDTAPDRLPERGSVEGPGDYSIPIPEQHELDRPVYAWQVEGGMASGTLADYARDLEQAHHADVFVSRVIYAAGDSRPAFYTGELRKIVPDIHQSEYDDDDYATVVITVRDGQTRDDVTDSASFRLDGRA